MRNQNILRPLFFVIFFTVGATAMCGSILCNELLRRCQRKELLKAGKQTSYKLKTVIADYDVLLEQCEKDPNLAERIAPAALGIEPADRDTVYPQATAEQLAAGKALTEDSDCRVSEPAVPDWLTRCSRPVNRVILFLAGAFLVLVSFVWFGPVKQKSSGRS